MLSTVTKEQHDLLANNGIQIPEVANLDYLIDFIPDTIEVDGLSYHFQLSKCDCSYTSINSEWKLGVFDCVSVNLVKKKDVMFNPYIDMVVRMIIKLKNKNLI